MYILSLSLIHTHTRTRTHTGAIPKVPVRISRPRNDAVTAPGCAMGSSISSVLYPTAPHDALLCTYIDPTEPDECKSVKRELRYSQKRPLVIGIPQDRGIRSKSSRVVGLKLAPPGGGAPPDSPLFELCSASASSLVLYV